MCSNAEAEALTTFKKSLSAGISTGIATIQGLLSVLSSSKATTVQELVHILKEATKQFKTVDCSTIAVKSTSDLFTLFITQKEHARLEREDFESCRRLMLARGATFLTRLEASLNKIVWFSEPFLASANTVLVHGCSRVVAGTLASVSKNRDIEVLLTKSSEEMRNKLSCENIRCRIIDDLAIGSEMHKVDCVLVGAEGVVETGGIVNQLGTYTVALVAKAHNKETYVFAESFKFVREYPLGQDDLPEEYLFSPSEINAKDKKASISPRVDYTPPGLISLLFTDLGILTPSAVSDELINLYL